jgi:dimethylamine monooxygenase subunit A
VSLDAASLERALRAALGKPFSIGLAPVDIGAWIEPDGRRDAELALRAEIFARDGRDAFDALPGSEAAQAEVAERLSEHLRHNFPDLPLTQTRPGEAPLLAISRNVQEDLLVLTREPTGWTLVAGSLCFPSTWRLREKIGRPMDLIHAAVPGFPGRFSELVGRIFDNLQPDALVERHNLSIYDDGELRHDGVRKGVVKFPADAAVADLAHVRVERQTLLRLPKTGAVLFTVRVRALKVAELQQDVRGGELIGAVTRHLAQMTEPQWAYKSLAPARERVMDAFEALTREAR